MGKKVQVRLLLGAAYFLVWGATPPEGPYPRSLGSPFSSGAPSSYLLLRSQPRAVLSPSFCPSTVPSINIGGGCRGKETEIEELGLPLLLAGTKDLIGVGESFVNSLIQKQSRGCTWPGTLSSAGCHVQNVAGDG